MERDRLMRPQDQGSSSYKYIFEHTLWQAVLGIRKQNRHRPCYHGAYIWMSAWREGRPLRNTW
jgi:hypothetical protein